VPWLTPVEDGLRLAVEHGEGGKAERIPVPNPKAVQVHGLGDTFGEHGRLHRGSTPSHGSEGLDEAGDGSEKAGQGRQVSQHGQVAGSLFHLGAAREGLPRPWLAGLSCSEPPALLRPAAMILVSGTGVAWAGCDGAADVAADDLDLISDISRSASTLHFPR